MFGSWVQLVEWGESWDWERAAAMSLVLVGGASPDLARASVGLGLAVVGDAGAEVGRYADYVVLKTRNRGGFRAYGGLRNVHFTKFRLLAAAYRSPAASIQWRHECQCASSPRRRLVKSVTTNVCGGPGVPSLE